jgi:hypothetical protein
VVIEGYMPGMFRDPQRALACLRAFELLLTRHLEADRGSKAPGGSLQYQFAARTAAELEATGGDASGRGPVLPDDPGAAPRTNPQPVRTPQRTAKVVPWS